MDNYKIKVKDEASADEARDLFKKIGYQPDNSSYEPYVGWVAVFEDGSGSFYRHNMNLDECVEITIAQLRDLVVLKRNDINDANCIDKKREAWYLASDGTYYAWQYRKLCWDTESDACVEAHDIKPINQPQDPSLISGAEAKLAWAKGIDIQIKNVNCVNWYDLDGSKYNLDIFDHVRVVFRLKPQTIKVELELPKPFEPKEGDEYFYISTLQNCLYSHDVWSDEPADITQTAFGAYRTEDDVKKAVEQLRKIRGTNS
ncbi:hypothetical protein [Acinetobacter baumannii]|uniref:hypothetical protein n=1 Tax=Acinetobacter baumannii TaxID=470 RepID=UPI000D65B2D8|nr:hypothetical protein [Acinetobacter baumannii]